jgi:1,4-dihydroxy-2-naphthoyl-CoA synthase
MVGTTGFAGEATRLAYMTEEEEGRNAFLEKKKTDFEKNGCRNSVISVQFLVFSHIS